ncbi:DUF2513 domain-containing protein [uncultured Roseobacter sp.]|uniref:DUF2513 domain-containing protein n=1 Tax=uncultured Roseobacter sp. TaxID=114847 RepID=UPI002632DAB5|nr:DUF2513 domain-containing protein [uncultured Roseobacter sp.]
MVRDDDYIRELLLEAEASKDPFILATLAMSAPPEDVKRHVHAELLADAGLFQELNDGVFRITNYGHDYLAAIRDDTIWKKTKAGAAKIGGTTLGMMGELALTYLKQKASEQLGVSLD